MRAATTFTTVLVLALVTIIPTQANAQTLMKLGKTCSYQAVYKFNDKRESDYVNIMQCRRIKKLKVVNA